MVNSSRLVRKDIEVFYLCRKNFTMNRVVYSMTIHLKDGGKKVLFPLFYDKFKMAGKLYAQPIDLGYILSWFLINAENQKND